MVADDGVGCVAGDNESLGGACSRGSKTEPV